MESQKLMKCWPTVYMYALAQGEIGDYEKAPQENIKVKAFLHNLKMWSKLILFLFLIFV